MSYVFQNIFMCLLIAGVIGGVIGWILHRLLSGSRITQLESDWTSRFEGERSKWTASLGEQEGLVAQWKGKFNGLEGDFGKLKSDFTGVQARIPSLEADLKACGEARTALQSQLAGWTEKAKVWDGERAKVTAELNGLQSGNAKLTADLGKIPVLEAAVAGWVAKSALWDGDRGKLDAELKAANSRISTLELDLDASQKFAATAKAQYEKAIAADRTEDAGYEKRIAELEGQLRAAQTASENKASDLSAKLAAATAAVAAAAVAKTALDGQVSSAGAEVESLKAQLKKAVADDASDDAAFRKEITELRARNQNLEHEWKAATKSTAQLKADLDKAITADKGDDAAYEKKIKTLEAELAKATGEAKRLADLGKADSASYEEKIGDLTSRLATMQSESTATQGKLTEMTALLASKSSAEESAAGEVGALRAQIDVLREQLQTASVESKRLADLGKADSASYEEKIGDLTARLATMQGESTATQGKLTEMTALMASKSSAEESAAGEVGALRAQIDVLREQLQTASVESKRLAELGKADSASYEEKIGDLKARLATMQGESTATQGKLTEMTALMASKSSAEESAAGEVGALRAQIDVLREQLQTASVEAKRLADLGKADSASYEEKIGDLTARLATMQSESTAAQGKLTEMTALMASKSSAEESAAGEVGALRAQIDVLREQLQTASVESKRLAELGKADSASYEEKIGDLKARLATMQGESTAKQGKLTEMSALMASKSSAEESAAGEVGALRAQIDVLREQLQTASVEAKRLADLGKADSASYEEKIGDLTARLATMQSESTAKQGKLTEMSALMASKSSAEESAAGEVGALRAQIDVLREQLQTASAEAKRVNDLARADIGTYEEQVTDLKARLATMQEESTGAQSRLAELQATHNRVSAAAGNQAGEISALRAQLDTTRMKLMEVEASATKAAAFAAAAAGVGATSVTSAAQVPPAAPPVVTDTRYDELKAKFDRYVVSLQREGYGDIERIEGIGPVYGQKLRSIGIAWVKTLLENGATPQGRKAIVAETGLDAKDVLTWVNSADLLRIDGMTPDWAELLEESGVDTVKELRGRIAENLQKKMEETNPKGPRGRFSPTVPDVAAVQRFIDIAKTLEPKVTH